MLTNGNVLDAASSRKLYIASEMPMQFAAVSARRRHFQVIEGDCVSMTGKPEHEKKRKGRTGHQQPKTNVSGHAQAFLS